MKKHRLANILTGTLLISALSGLAQGSEAEIARKSAEFTFDSISAANGEYLIGTGIYDITGPAAEVGMMGFADGKQITSGIQMRLRSRAFIVGDETKRVVVVSADLGMLFQMVKLKVSEKVAANAELAPYYNEKNILLSATHTHGGPGGYSGYFLYDATIKGFIKPHFDMIVDGIYQSILRAHHNLQPGKVLINVGTLDGVAGNRAEIAYNNNPAEERALYDGNVDKTFTLIKFVSKSGEEIGMFNWYAVHPDSIGPANTLITGDNKGWAAYLFEKEKGTNYLASKTFVAGFAQANEGDVTPNFAFGNAPPDLTLKGNKGLENAVLKQYGKAKELYDSATEELTGSVDYRHEWVDMRELYVESAGRKTCAAGMGASFSAGSPLDNPSPAPLFESGTTVDSLSWQENAGGYLLSKFLGGIFSVVWKETSSAEYKDCQAEKPILIPTGVAHLNFNGPTMTPQIMPIQLFKIGSLALVAAPNEVTTMSGRRFRKAVVDELASVGVKYGVISSLANSYSSYLATREEYAKQWYEGACTQFGPNEQAGFQQEYVKLSRAIVNGTDIAPGPTPPDLMKSTVDFTSKVPSDSVPKGSDFGSVIIAPNASYARGEKVSVQFWGAHPSNNYRTQDSFLVIEKQVEGIFIPVLHDWDPETTFQWTRSGKTDSRVTIAWDTSFAEAGTYRVRYKGNRKLLLGGDQVFEGTSGAFTVN
ncbi:MAG: neutral/alkaline ceramidase [Oligoflexus sp.]|nr:neutral/alkaline ceramidase [Oligoflexus sp.]